MFKEVFSRQNSVMLLEMPNQPRSQIASVCKYVPMDQLLFGNPGYKNGGAWGGIARAKRCSKLVIESPKGIL